ncbi:hypothetical protein EC917_101315 [Bacillus thuringiensis]|uniref:Uncharacterized protein n=1 Tax=Bacillus thuringiensis TaxID=1428 RepID=A0A4R4BM12_BACTU|nr:hypothetical protein EC917_101315 [Bacillus thuringiensis]TCW59699.1 hypothetical protein EC910_101329 [Bacillus thuringiensis]
METYFLIRRMRIMVENLVFEVTQLLAESKENEENGN